MDMGFSLMFRTIQGVESQGLGHYVHLTVRFIDIVFGIEVHSQLMTSLF